MECADGGGLRGFPARDHAVLFHRAGHYRSENVSGTAASGPGLSRARERTHSSRPERSAPGGNGGRADVARIGSSELRVNDHDDRSV